MESPPDLPWIVYWRMSGHTTRVALPRRPVQSISTSGVTDAALVCPQIPLGATAWSLDGRSWRPLAEIPAAWLPFLDRQRPSAHDFRTPPKRG